MLEIAVILVLAAVAAIAVTLLRRLPELVTPEEDEDAVDLPCPWCNAPTREDDVVCPGCQQPFGVLSQEPPSPARRS